jgi:coatomer subunit beta
LKPRYIRLIFELLNASSHAVKYEAATTLTTLTQNPAAVKAAASCFISLVVKESDNNVKLIVLDRLDTLRANHGGVLDSLIMDILEVISSADMDVRKKAISIVLSMTSSKNVEEVVLFMKKQLQKTQTADFDKVRIHLSVSLKIVLTELMRIYVLGSRVQTTAHSEYTCHSYQILRSSR